ncbi:MAG: hypothetical protein ACKVS8_04405 [Phycisphaerales bacterium]
MAAHRTWRVARSLLIAAVLGLMTSVLLAWAISLAPPRRSASTTMRQHTEIAGVPTLPTTLPAGFEFNEQHHPGLRRTTFLALDAPLLNTHVLDHFHGHRSRHLAELKFMETATAADLDRATWPHWLAIPPTAPAALNSLMFRAVGWPQRCLLSQAWTDAAGDTRNRGCIRVMPLHASQSGYPDPHLGTIPLLPIWTGLAVNTGFFAIPWGIGLVAFHAWRRMRTRRRHKLGHCPACGYDLLRDFSKGCPECGWNRADNHAK